MSSTTTPAQISEMIRAKTDDMMCFADIIMFGDMIEIARLIRIGVNTETKLTRQTRYRHQYIRMIIGNLLDKRVIEWDEDRYIIKEEQQHD